MTPGGMMLDSLFRGLTLPEYDVGRTGIRRPMKEEERMLRVDPVKFNVIPPDIMELCDSAVRKSQKNT